MAMTLDEIKKLPPLMKALIIVVAYLLIGYLFYMNLLSSDLEKRSNLQSKFQDLEQQVSAKERLAAELGKYAKGVDNLKEEFKTALTKLPIRQEIPELLNNVALAGKSSGMTFLLFEPLPSVRKPIGGKSASDQKTSEKKPAEKKQPEKKPEDKKATDAKGKAAKPPEAEEYYEEIPVKVKVSGSYQNTLVFFERVAKLPRIINIEDIAIEESKLAKGKARSLTTSCVIKTYMFVQQVGEKAAGDKDKKTDEKDKKTDEKKK